MADETPAPDGATPEEAKPAQRMAVDGSELDPKKVDPQALCPSCGRFVGPRTFCPFCGAGMKTRMSLKLFRWGSVGVALLGLAFLYGWARAKEIETVKIGDITETMSMAYVKVVGDIGHVSMNRDKKGHVEYLNFSVDDGTGVVRVKAHRHAAAALEARNLLPRRGDRIEVAGSLRVADEGQVTMFIQTASHVKLIPAEVERVALSALDVKRVGDIVTVEGRIDRVYEPREGSKAPYKALIRQDEGSSMLVMWASIHEELEKKGFGEGVRVVARVTVGEYRGKIQLTLESGADLLVEGAAAPRPSKPAASPDGVIEPGAVTDAMVRRAARVRGRVSRILLPPEGSKNPGKFVLEGGGGTIEVVAWGETFEAILKKGLAEGDMVEVRAEVSRYRDRLQLKPGGAHAVTVGEKAPPPALPENGVLEPGMVDRRWLGREVTVKGTVESVTAYNHGIKLRLSGESGLDVYVKRTTADLIDGLKTVARGAVVIVKGEISEYRGKLQIQPEGAEDLTIESAGDGSAPEVTPPQERRIATITSEDRGKIVIVTGAVQSLTKINKGTKFMIDDGSGKTIVVMLWDSVAAKMQNREGLEDGVKVQVVGRVGEYRQELQVVPQEGWDITVLPE